MTTCRFANTSAACTAGVVFLQFSGADTPNASAVVQDVQVDGSWAGQDVGALFVKFTADRAAHPSAVIAASRFRSARAAPDL